jgi:hypothetical protein
MPEGVRRGRHENFCIRCAKCEAKGRKLPCYARRLSHWHTYKTCLKEPVSRVYCEGNIPKGTQTVVQKLYAWPDSETLDEPDNIRETISKRGFPNVSLFRKRGIKEDFPLAQACSFSFEIAS